jgi:hypothetical protein
MSAMEMTENTVTYPLTYADMRREIVDAAG